MRLLFEWIKCDIKKIFSDLNVNFTSDYNISYDSKSSTLKIDKKLLSIPTDFYSFNDNKVVSQVSCFVGKNGSGKTSLLKHIFSEEPFKTESDWDDKYNYKTTLQVYEFGTTLKIYHNLKQLTVISALEYKVYDYAENEQSFRDEVLNNGDYAKLTTVYLSNDYYVSINGHTSNKGTQSKIAFTQYDIGTTQDIFFNRITNLNEPTFYHKTLLHSFNECFRKNANQSHLQNIMDALFLKYLITQTVDNEFNFLKKMKIEFQSIAQSDTFGTYFGTHSLIINQFTVEKIIRQEISDSDIDKIINQCGIQDFDANGLRFCAVYLLATNKLKMEPKTSYDYLKINLTTEILLSLSDKIDICDLRSYDIIDLLELFKQKLLDIAYADGPSNAYTELKCRELEYFSKAYYSIHYLCKKIPILSQSEQIDVDKNLRILDIIDKEVKSGNSFLLKYIWVKCGCSAGERAFLNIFSWLNFIPYLKYCSDVAIHGTHHNLLIIIDEPDLYCHPEWERKMFNKLIKTFELLYQDYSIHLILSTHSPLFLSDIPSENVWGITNGPNDNKVIVPMTKPTLGANIFDLYNDGFYLDSFIGEFAQRKISALIRKISQWYFSDKIMVSDEELNTAKHIVDLIGEPILERKLNEMLIYIQERKNS